MLAELPAPIERDSDDLVMFACQLQNALRLGDEREARKAVGHIEPRLVSDHITRAHGGKVQWERVSIEIGSSGRISTARNSFGEMRTDETD